MGDPMLKIEKCCEGDRALPAPQKSENKFRVIWLTMRKDSYCNSQQILAVTIVNVHSTLKLFSIWTKPHMWCYKGIKQFQKMHCWSTEGTGLLGPLTRPLS